MKGVINALKYVLSFSQESTKERPRTFRMVLGLPRRPKGLTVPLETPMVRKYPCFFAGDDGEKASLCKGGWQKSLIFDWRIVA